MANTYVSITLARKHLGGDLESSARLCLEDAIRFFEEGDYERAKKRATDSLRYSVGVSHDAFKAAAKGAA